jgi:hypothetical protein
LPEEVVALYEWHNGMEPYDHQLIWYHHFPSLQVAIEFHRGMVRDGGWSEVWFPVLEFEVEYFVVPLIGGPAGPVKHLHHGFSKAPAFTNVTLMMATAAEWFDRGLIKAEDTLPAGHKALMDVNMAMMRDIHASLNPGASFPYAIR